MILLCLLLMDIFMKEIFKIYLFHLKLFWSFFHFGAYSSISFLFNSITSFCCTAVPIFHLLKL